ncbi:hypothetical protein H6F90_03705 [Trichocoleus sp. FACHB-591]|uniref:hypothetical protein n=1 Tax=Trichocoleus sp. FACHB-591 TaxID=2692872 RepID=UPI0016845FC0|nr:hypothetical protein [Trichocoleus sp. FACHB-591]MBD2094252.1 hypothetical protein [Trichocoleus sp. FACHB-591]
MITTEIQLPDSLFDQLQQVLHTHPALSWNVVLCQALHAYLPQLVDSEPQDSSSLL